MVSITKRKITGQEYFYLEHSIRKGKKVSKKQKYLGKKLPKNIEELKKQFIYEVYQKNWITLIETIKKEHKKEQKLMPISAKNKELDNFAIRFTYNTQRIEGSTLTLKETANLLEDGITPKEKSIDDVKEAEAHKKAFYEMLDTKSLSLQTVLSWHKILMQETKSDIAGTVRKHQVAILRSKFVSPVPIEVDILLKEFFSWYQKSKNKIHPVELAGLSHLKFVTIHPFSDGNGRISRLIMNYILHESKYPMLNITYDTRNSYYNALERSQVKEEEYIFIHWFFKNYTKHHEK